MAQSESSSQALPPDATGTTGRRHRVLGARAPLPEVALLIILYLVAATALISCEAIVFWRLLHGLDSRLDPLSGLAVFFGFSYIWYVVLVLRRPRRARWSWLVCGDEQRPDDHATNRRNRNRLTGVLFREIHALSGTNWTRARVLGRFLGACFFFLLATAYIWFLTWGIPRAIGLLTNLLIAGSLVATGIGLLASIPELLSPATSPDLPLECRAGRTAFWISAFFALGVPAVYALLSMLFRL